MSVIVPSLILRDIHTRISFSLKIERVHTKLLYLFRHRRVMYIYGQEPSYNQSPTQMVLRWDAVTTGMAFVMCANKLTRGLQTLTHLPISSKTQN